MTTFNSVLLSIQAFSKNGEATMTAKNQPDLKLGQKFGLSARDIQLVNALFTCGKLNVFN